jgi:hypothetical protein
MMNTKTELPIEIHRSLPLISWLPVAIMGIMSLISYPPNVHDRGVVIVALRYGALSFPGRSGLIAGTGAASWGGVVAVVMPIVGRYFDHNQYASAFYFVAAFPIVGLIGWRLLGFRQIAGSETKLIGVAG